jgi:hypothetical protein
VQYDYYYHIGHMRQVALRQEAEHERLVQMAQQGTPRFYHHWASWAGRAMMQSGQQLVQLGHRDQNGVATKSPRHAALPVTGMHALKVTQMLPERKI